MAQSKPVDVAKTLVRLQRIARMMDTAWRIPFTRLRFGLDSVFGLVPGAGDLVALAVSAYAFSLAMKLGAPRKLLLRMAGNKALDFGVGSIPIVGDVFDLLFNSNTKNTRLLAEFIKQNRET